MVQRRFRIGIVDDDPFVRQFLKMALTQIGRRRNIQFDIQTYANPQAALANDHRPVSFWILDFFYEGGYDTADSTLPEFMLALMRQYPEAKFAVISARPEKIEGKILQQSGAGYLIEKKPGYEDRLAALITNLL